MYRHTASSYMMKHSLPSPEYTGDSDSDSEIAQELEEKRRHLDEEIAKFKAQKDREFRDFEQDLRSRRKQKRVSPPSPNPVQIEVTKPGALTTSPSPSGGAAKARTKSKSKAVSPRKSKEPIRLMTPDVRLQTTSPTLSLEKMNITAQDTSMSHDSLDSLSINSLGRVSSQSSSESIPRTPPYDKSDLTPKQERPDAAFSGLFIPSYLPLLEAKLGPRNLTSTTDQPIAEVHTEPASPNHSLVPETTELQASSLPSETTLSREFELLNNPRAYTAPAISTQRLAPIIRNVNGRKASVRKRKRVTFQLADRAIVDPSSSYEEGPSPSLESDRGSDTSSSRSDSHSSGNPRKRAPRDPYGRPVGSDGLATKQEEVGMGMGDLMMASEYGDPSSEFFPQPSSHDSLEEVADGYFSPRHHHGAELPNENSAEQATLFEKVDDDRYLLKQRDRLRAGRSSSKSPLSSPPVPKQPRSKPQDLRDMETPIDINATGNVGFFELDEELSSPGASEPKPFVAEESDDTAVNKEDTELEDLAMVAAAKGFSQPAPKRTSATFAVGSVPIDIVKPSSHSWQSSVTNSWIGTFGH